ncbi:MAG: DUF397 domain-containing protein [Corynebacteriales bacterium]|nr:DUF397 domain-containing protein [Mycobacteriales bacterium]
MIDVKLHPAIWRTSSRCTEGSNCVAVAASSQEVAVRDTKAQTTPELSFSINSWRCFVEAIAR